MVFPCHGEIGPVGLQVEPKVWLAQMEAVFGSTNVRAEVVSEVVVHGVVLHANLVQLVQGLGQELMQGQLGTVLGVVVRAPWALPNLARNFPMLLFGSQPNGT